MKITIKNLQQQTFTVEIEMEKTVLDLKNQIFIERGAEYVVERQKLIYAGVILEDERTIESYSIDEKKFIVVMLKRDLGGVAQKIKNDSGGSVRTDASISSSSAGDKDAKREVKSDLSERKVDDSSKSANTTGSESTVQPSPVVGSDREGSGTAATVVDTNTASETSQSSSYSSGDLAGVFSTASLQSRAEASLLMGEEYNRSVESIVEMGYCREMVLRAMAASFNNPERAVEYLISGIPENEDGFNVPGAEQMMRGTAEGGGIAAVSGGDVTARDSSNRSSASSTETSSRAADPFDFLRNQPQFLQMRSLVYQNPELLHAVLQQIGHTNPALLQLISENQDAFLSMLNQPLESSNANSPFANRRLTPGRRTQLTSGNTAGSGDGIHIQSSDADPRGGGDSTTVQRPGGGGDAGGDSAAQDALSQGSDRNARRVGSSPDAYLSDRAAAAAAVAALTAAANAAAGRTGTVEGSGSGGGTGTGTGSGSGSGSISGSGSGSEQPGEEEASINISTDGEEITTLRLTQQDQIAIERLKALGFPEALVLQAYFACGKDEQLAANFLISTSFDD